MKYSLVIKFLEDNFNLIPTHFLQGYAVLPLLPISFPIVWICLNLYGTARIKVLFTHLKEKENVSVIYLIILTHFEL